VQVGQLVQVQQVAKQHESVVFPGDYGQIVKISTYPE
jgi:hypothetical protein